MRGPRAQGILDNSARLLHQMKVVDGNIDGLPRLLQKRGQLPRHGAGRLLAHL